MVVIIRTIIFNIKISDFHNKKNIFLNSVNQLAVKWRVWVYTPGSHWIFKCVCQVVVKSNNCVSFIMPTHPSICMKHHNCSYIHLLFMHIAQIIHNMWRSLNLWTQMNHSPLKVPILYPGGHQTSIPVALPDGPMLKLHPWKGTAEKLLHSLGVQQ